MMVRLNRLRRLGTVLLVLSGLSACASEVGFDLSFIPEERPAYVANGQILIVMPPFQRSLVFQGPPSSARGNFTTLTIPMGALMMGVSEEVFAACFAEGVAFAEDIYSAEDYVVAIEAKLLDFLYSYTDALEVSSEDRRTLEVSLEDTDVLEGNFGNAPENLITPQVRVELEVTAYDSGRRTILEKTYNSGLVSGEAYFVSYRPQEKINRTLHATLHGLMLQVAADIRPLLNAD